MDEGEKYKTKKHFFLCWDYANFTDNGHQRSKIFLQQILQAY